ncbi:hypothetical protein KEM52_004850 [Ascosphaera acerosa]|nr:hypothetical protein KEM52_004850 [Ascosphaera acerosa]
MDSPALSTSTLSPTNATVATFGKRWRDKLRTNKDKKQASKASVDEVVNDFLGVHRRNQSSNDFNAAGANANAPASPPYVAPVKNPRPRRPGLHVSFDLGPPGVIGEGGEEADLPTKHIGLNRPQEQAQDAHEIDDEHDASLEDAGTPTIAVSGSTNDELGFDSDWRPPLTTDTTLLRALSSAGLGSKRRSRLSMRLDDETATLARKVRAKMMEEEGRALHRKPSVDEDDRRDASQDQVRQSIDAIDSERDSIGITAPQPQRVVAYRPSVDDIDEASMETSRVQDSDDGRHVQQLVSSLRISDDSDQRVTNSEQNVSHKHSNSAARQLPAFNPFDLQTELRPRSRDHDRPPSPIKEPASTPPGSGGSLASLTYSSNINQAPGAPQQQQSYQRHSPSPEHDLQPQPASRNASSSWKSTLSRANTTARPRQPMVSGERSVSRSLSMRSGSKTDPPINPGWQRFQYQPVARSPVPDSNSRPPSAGNPHGDARIERPEIPVSHASRPSVQEAFSAAVPASREPARPSNSSLRDLAQESALQPSGSQSSLRQSPVETRNSPVPMSSTPLPTYDQALTPPLHQQAPDPASQPEPQTPKKSWRSLASAVTRDALADFSASAALYYPIFAGKARDAIVTATSIQDKGLDDWIRASVWWVLKGRSQLEAAIRYGGSAPHLQQQGVVSLAKAWWMNAEVIPAHAELTRLKQQAATSNGAREGNGKDIGTEIIFSLARGLGDARLNSLITLHQAVSSHIRALATSMKRNNIVIPTPDQLPQNADLSIWISYPHFGADVTALLSASVPKSLRVDQRSKASDIDVSELLPFNDTTRFFNYGRMFVNAVLVSPGDEDDVTEQDEMPCVVSLARDRQDWHVLALIASQSGLVNVVIQSDKRQGPTWHDVRFDSRFSTAVVRLSRSWKLELKFQGPDGQMDFDRLRKMVDYTRTVEAGLNPEENEDIVFETVLKAFQYVGAPGAAGSPFPAEPTQRCRVRLFEKQVPMAENGGTRFMHMGFRLICVTSPKVKNLSCLTHHFSHSAPIVFAHARSKDDGENSPILLLKIANRHTGAPFQIRLTFHENSELIKLHSLLLNVCLADTEAKTPDIGLQSYSIQEPAMATRTNATFLPSFLDFPGQVTGSAVKAGVTVAVINTAKEFLDHGQSTSIMSNSLRLFVKCGWGSVTDRMNLGPGELKIGLDPRNLLSFSIFRRGQHDLLVSMADNLMPPEARENIPSFLKAAGSTPTIRKLDFRTLRDLHRFQTALTGFEVLFDGTD